MTSVDILHGDFIMVYTTDVDEVSGGPATPLL